MSVMEQKPARSRRSFTDEFKRDAVAMVLDDGNKIAEVARRLGIGEGTLGNWVAQARTDRGERAGLTTSERAELAELRRENARLRMERDLLKRATAFLGEGVGAVTRYRWVAARKAEGFPITMACKVARVSRQVFHDWRAGLAAGPTDAEVAEAALVAEIREIHDTFDGTYGEPRMTTELARRGRTVNHKRIERLMRALGIVGVHKPAKVRTTIPAEDARCPTWSAAVSTRARPMSPGSATSPTSLPGRAGCMWRRVGHDLKTLLSTYAHVFRQDEDRLRVIVDEALGDAEDWLRTEVV